MGDSGGAIAPLPLRFQRPLLYVFVDGVGNCERHSMLLRKLHMCSILSRDNTKLHTSQPSKHMQRLHFHSVLQTGVWKSIPFSSFHPKIKLALATMSLLLHFTVGGMAQICFKSLRTGVKRSNILWEIQKYSLPGRPSSQSWVKSKTFKNVSKVIKKKSIFKSKNIFWWNKIHQ